MNNQANNFGYIIYIYMFNPVNLELQANACML